MNIRPLYFFLGGFCYVTTALQTALADDTEIYVSRNLPADQQVRPNLLFIIDNSGSMDAAVAGTTCTIAEKNIRNRCATVKKCTGPNWNKVCTTTYNKTRLQVVKDVTNELVEELRLSDDVNIGLMHFDSSDTVNGSMVAIPVSRASTVANEFKTEVSKLYAYTSTPLSESLYEAARYMKGETPKFGNDTTAAYEDANNSGDLVSKPSVASSKNGTNYISPIKYSCQKSNIILLTDGEPTSDTAANSDINALIQVSGAANTKHTSDSCVAGSNSGVCMPHLAEHMANQDQSPQAGKQTVSTYTIGFASSQTLLQNTASAGNGRYFTTDNTSGLVTALKSILVEILAENTTFATPSVAVSAYNNLGYRNDLYYALFRPAEGARWVGNVKRYALKPETITAGGVKVAAHIVDKDGLPAVDTATGFFKESASSYWSSQDGRDVAKGGIAGLLKTPSARSIYTWTANDRSPSADTGSIALTSNANALLTTNAAITNDLTGAATSTDRDNAINWGRGLDPSTGLERKQLADVLHNEPRLVAYKTDEDLARVEAAKNGAGTSPEQLYMFFGTNEGFIHAVDPKSGEEKFAFIPKELLPNLKSYYQDPKGSVNKRYGMDGQFNLWVEYGATNAVSKTRDISKSILYAGMRRGGRNYYALDVGNINTPALKWVIKGGTTPGFAKLGQTWSTPKLANIKINNVNTKVLIFTGGYTSTQSPKQPLPAVTMQDDDTSEFNGSGSKNAPRPSDPEGNSLYIVNAETGQLIWRAGHTDEADADLKLAEMTHSIPADPVIIDIDGDGLADILYAADSRAQVFRFDINNANTGASNLATGGRIAQLGGDSALNNRRFYNTPDVALVRERGGKTYFTISLGSGYRAHPLNEDTIDSFYVLRDSNVFNKPATYSTLTEDDLVNVSSVDLSAAAAAKILEDIKLKEDAIKALNKSVIDANDAFNALKDTSGFTNHYNTMLQANSSANDKQAEIDTILTADPFLSTHVTESAEQAKLQQGLGASQQSLTTIKQALDIANTDSTAKEAAYNSAQAAKTAAEDALEAANNGGDQTAIDAAEVALGYAVAAYGAASIAADAALDKQHALMTQTQSLADMYGNAIALQSNLDSMYQSIQAKEQAIIAAKASYASDETIGAMQADLSNLNQSYELAASSSRGVLNNSEALINALANVDSAVASGNTANIQNSLNSLQLLLPAGGPEQNTAELLARKESEKQTLLSNSAHNYASNLALIGSMNSQRDALLAQASAAQTQANLLSNAAYVDSPALTSAQLTAAKTIYGNDISVFEAYQYLIDQAQLATLDPLTGLPGLRQDINELYAQLTPGNNYVPNKLLLANSQGWYLRVPKGEKILSASLSYRGAVLFNTFSPRGETVTTCGPDVGRGRAYALNLIDASAIFSKNNTPIRSYALVRSGIPPSPAVVFSDNGKPSIINGSEIGGVDAGASGNSGAPDACVPGAKFCENPEAVSSTYWREN